MIVSQLMDNKIVQWLNDRVNGQPIQLIKIRIKDILVQWYQYHGQHPAQPAQAASHSLLS